jgi:hypothetical protein
MKPNGRNGKPSPRERLLRVPKVSGAKTARGLIMKNPGKPKIVFVYNADSGVFNLVSDIAHKIFSPQTYACNLCAITHSNLGMRREWKEYLESLKNPLEFLHADELKDKYRLENVKLPAIFIEEGGVLMPLVEADRINQSKSIQDLKDLIDRRLNA